MAFLRQLPKAAGSFAALSAALAFHKDGTAAAASPPVTELKYWNGRGLMDTPRMMLVLAGKSFQDVRIGEGEGYTPMDRLGDLGANLGRVPICETSLGSIGQSSAINYYVATQCGLMGDSPFEAAKILEMCAHIKELSDAYRSLVPYGSEPTAAALDKFFDLNEARDSTGRADMTKRSSRFLRWYLGRIEALIPGDGYLVGGKTSLADVMLFDLIANDLSPESAPALSADKREPFTSATRTQAVLAAYPKTKAVIAKLSVNKNLAAWRAGRKNQMF